MTIKHTAAVTAVLVRRSVFGTQRSRRLLDLSPIEAYAPRQRARAMYQNDWALVVGLAVDFT
jgi:hypothetical protein